MSTQVRYFDSTMSGAPTLSGTAGTLISVLDACLVNGIGSVVVNNLVVASNIATATVSTGHNFPLVGSTGAVIRIEGATPSGLNGDFRIQSATTTTFTFTTSGITDQTATGTISAKRAPAGFSKAFSGTNKAVYRADDVASTRMYLRVDDTAATIANLVMYETMSDVDVGTGSSPLTGSMAFTKSYQANGTARPWRLYADSQIIYLYADANPGSYLYFSALAFGDILPAKSGDAFHCAFICNSAYAYSTLFNGTGYLARSYTQIGGTTSLTHDFHRRSKAGNGCGSAGAFYPNPADNSFYATPVEVWEGSVIRGIQPGFWNPLHAGLTDGLLIENIPELPNRTLIMQACVGSYRIGMDITGPWR